ncbi:MAG: carboxylesterase family protein [Kofleriaceae bacterium]
MSGPLRAVVELMNRSIAILWVLATACGGGEAERDAGVVFDAGPVGIDVETDRGPVRGVADDDLLVFRGIPFATAPRFAPPELRPAWTAPFQATTFGPACPQISEITPQAEDCLALNVWAHPGVGSRPVNVWIHGGGYVSGAAREALYDAAALARATDAVVISIDYRLGVLGFLALPELVAADGGTGNWGLRDQIAALGWVKRNARAFGGDPDRVTITGESAGGASICTLLAAPLAQGLYRAAVMQSGSCRLVMEKTATFGTFPGAYTVGAELATRLGCTTEVASCLRAKPTAELVALVPPVAFDIGLPITLTLPVVDGVVLEQRPMAAIRGGRGNVPILAGSNKEDTSYFVVNAMGVTNTPGAFDRYLDRLPVTADQKTVLRAMYPAALVTEIGAATALSTDLAFACPALALASTGTGNFLYELDRHASGILTGYGAVHGLDFIHLFGSFSQWLITPTASDLVVRDAIQGAWGKFARDLTPGAGWPAAPAAFVLDDPTSTRASWRAGRCAQLSSLGLLLE